MHSLKLKQKLKVNKSLPSSSHFQFVFDAIGTHWIIDINNSLSREDKNKLLDAINYRIEVFDNAYSRFRDDSIVSQISHKKGTYIFPEDFSEMILMYKKMYLITEGLVTPLIGNVLEQAGYDKDYSLEQKDLVSPDSWDSVLDISENKVIVKKPVTLDFGAIGKGYLIDIVGNILMKHNVDSFCIDAGGDMLIKNMEMSVGFEQPDNVQKVIGVHTLLNGSICGSAGNRRKWGKMHHIINPKTLESVSDIVAVWVCAESAMIADALTTGLFFVSPEKFDEFEFEYLIIYSDYSYKNSQLFPRELYVG